MVQCAERLHELANTARAKLNTVSTPSLEERNIADCDFDKPGELLPIAATALINISYAARMVWFDLLQPVTPLA